MITRREAKEIVDFVISELNRRRFPYVTDGRLDLTKSPAGAVSGTQTYGGSIADGAVWDRHVHPNADIRGTKVRIATTSERGTVELAEHYETASGLALQSTDPRLHDVAPSGSTEHDVRYGSTESGLGASLIGVHDAEGDFSGTDVETVLHEIFAAIGAMTFLELTDTPSQYEANWSQKGFATVINQTEDGLEFKPIDYIDGGGFDEEYAGATASKRSIVDGESFTGNTTLDGGTF